MCSKTTVDVHIRWLLNSCMFCTSSSFYRQFIGLGYCHCIDIPSLVFLRSTLLFVIPEYETNQPQNPIMLVWAETFLFMYSFILSYCKKRKYLRVVPTHLRHLRHHPWIHHCLVREFCDYIYIYIVVYSLIIHFRW